MEENYQELLEPIKLYKYELKYKHEDIKKIDKSLDESYQILNSYPIYQEYKYLQEDLDNTFQVVDENTDTVDEMLYPRDTSGSFENVAGCVCEIEYLD